MRTVRVTAQVNRWGERIYEGVPNDIVDTVVRDLVSKGFEVRQFHSSQKYGLTRIEARPKPVPASRATIEK